MEFRNKLCGASRGGPWVNLCDEREARLVGLNPRDPLGVREYLRRHGYAAHGLYVGTGEDTPSILSQAVLCGASVGVTVTPPRSPSSL
jgi:hypothetical protein